MTTGLRLLPVLAIVVALGSSYQTAVSEEPNTGSGCDILLSASEQAAEQCSCENRDEPSSNLPSVSQLKCDASSLELISLLSGAHVGIDYLTLNLSTPFENHQHLPSQSTWAGAEQPGASHSPLQVEHMSLQLNQPQEPAAMGQRWPQMVQRQTLQLLHLINGSRLLSLTIFHEKSNYLHEAEPSTSSTGSDVSLELSELLSKLPNLTRLQLNAMPYKIHLNLATGSAQTSLRWLSLYSNELLTFAPDVQLRDSGRCGFLFSGAYGLEQISLEANGIRTFPLLSMLGAQSPQASYVGLANLTSLNLASNMLSSFEKDLLQDTSLLTSVHGCSLQNNPATSPLFVLPSLTQLDLSHNKLAHLTFEVGKQLLQIMPNLNHLYLQHNQIAHVNLNSLLTSQFTGIPESIHAVPANKISNNQATVEAPGSSRLEYLDLSYNELRAITAIFDAQLPSTVKQGTQSNRFKSINLSHNYLTRPLQLIHSSFINSILFKESFDLDSGNHLNLLTVDSTFALTTSLNYSSASLCDFLSPSPAGEELLTEVILNDNQLMKLTASDLSGNKCKDIQILHAQRNQIRDLEPNALAALVELEHFDISHNQLASVSEQTFARNSKLKLLNLAYNKLTYLSKETLWPLIQLEELFLQGNQLVELWNHLFIHNPLIGTLNLSRNRLKSIEPFTLEPLKQLKLLNLSGNQLSSFSHLLFSNSSSLASAFKFSSPSQAPSKLSKALPNHRPRASKPKTQRQQEKKNQKGDLNRKRKQRQIGDTAILVLGGNQIKLWKFDECNLFSSNAQSAWLDNNKLEMITEASFKCFSSSIERLYLQWNNIKAIEENAMRNMSQLQYLDLSNNQLITIRAKTFSGLPSLRHIDLSRNQLINFDLLSAFQASLATVDTTLNSRQIEFISLAHNTKLDLQVSSVVHFLQSQQQSTVSWHQIDLSCIGSINQSNQSWNVTPLVDKTTIEFLNLSSNRHLADLFFEFLSDPMLEISKLDLTNVTLDNYGSQSSIGGLLKQQLSTSLTELNLSNNNKQVSAFLKFLPQQQQLLHLDLSSSGLDSWPAMGPEIGSQLRFLNLSRNKLRSFIGSRQLDNYQELIRLDTLDLSFNALLGLIDQHAVPAGKRTVNLRYLAPSIRRLDLSHNQLTWIPDKFFEGSSRLSWLKLDHNQLETFHFPLTHGRIHIELGFNHKLASVVLEDESTNVRTNTAVVNVDELLAEDNYVVFVEHQEESQLTCKPLREFIASETGPTLRGWPQNDKLVETFEEQESMGAQCSKLIATTDTVTLQSTGLAGSLVSLGSIRTSANKLVHLNLRQSGISQLEAVVREEEKADASNVILLDLSINKLKNLSESFCSRLNRLRTLDLSFNHFTDFSTESVSLCSQLKYLDLSHNRVSQWSSSNYNATSPIQVLKLAHNSMLTLLDSTQLLALTKLRYIDLRGNRLNHINGLQRLPLPIAISTDVIGLDLNLQSAKPVLKLNGASVVVDVSNVPDRKFSQITVQHSDTQGEKVSSKHQFKNQTFEVSLCTLSNRFLTEICLLGGGVLCFSSRRPPEVPSCITDLQETHIQAKASENTHLLHGPPSPAESISNQLLSSLSSRKDDVLPSFIEYLKDYWLNLSELDLNEYLNKIASTRGEPVFTLLNGRYPIYTVTLIKLAGSCCIIILLLALFVVVANVASSKHSNQSNSKHGFSSVAETCGSSNKSSASDNSVLQTQTSSNSGVSNVCPSSSSLASGFRSGSGSSRYEESMQLETVLERRAPSTEAQLPLKLNANHLLAASDHIQAPAACSTPSSSLAPSSAETGETLYAIDSIQSGYSSMVNGNSVDQYSYAPLETLDQQLTQHQNQQKQQVATVMRMIKSNSTNFDASANFRAPAGYQPDQQHARYGTLNANRIAVYQQHHLHQNQFQLDPSNHRYGSLVYLNPPVCADADPRTHLDGVSNGAVSLVSLNAVAQGSMLDQQMSLEAHQGQLQADQSYQQQQSLCSYHRLLGAKDKAAASVIEERAEEEEEPVSLRTLRATLPPPPDSLAIAALEDPLLFLHATSGLGSSSDVFRGR